MGKSTAERETMDLPHLARRLADVPRRSLELALGAPEQLAELFQATAVVVTRATRLLNRADLIVARLEHKLDEFDELTNRSYGLIEKADRAADATASVAQEAHATREFAELQLARMRQLLDTYQPLMERLAPLGDEVAAALKPAHVRGIASLLNEIPNLVDRLEPALEGMGNLLPHLDSVTDRMDTVGQVVEGLPGAKLLRRRGQARVEQESE
jgi:ABC-type transporter Mla subunit MlaD